MQRQSNNNKPINNALAKSLSSRNQWLTILPVLGVAACCGVPALGAWLASIGLLTAIGPNFGDGIFLDYSKCCYHPRGPQYMLVG